MTDVLLRASAARMQGVSAETHPRERRIYHQLFKPCDARQNAPQTEAGASPIFGGGSVTDNPNRFIYYPSHPVPGNPGGVILASYTWADDASRWDSMEDEMRYVHALRGLIELHGEHLRDYYLGGATQSWLRNPYAFGEAAVFTPWQLTQLHEDIPHRRRPGSLRRRAHLAEARLDRGSYRVCRPGRAGGQRRHPRGGAPRAT